MLAISSTLDRFGFAQSSWAGGQNEDFAMHLRIFVPEESQPIESSATWQAGKAAGTLYRPDASEDERIANIVAKVVGSLQKPAQAIPGLSAFLENVVMPSVQKKSERDARSLAVRRMTERVGICARCRISWRLDGATDACPRCNDTRTTDPGIDLIDSSALSLLAASLCEDDGSPATARKHITYLMTILNRAAEMGHIRKVKKPRIRQPESVIRVLSDAELAGLYKASEIAVWPAHDQCKAADWWRAFFVMMAVYGFRIGELTSLPWCESKGSKKLARGFHASPACPHPELKHLELVSEHGWMVYLPAKQSDAKPLPLVLPVRDVAATHLAAIKGDRQFVFDCYSGLRNRKAGDYRDVKISLYRQWNALCEQAGITLRATPHDLRRTQETNYDLQFGKGTGGEVNGHASRSVSDSYYSQAVPRLHKFVLQLQLPTFEK